MNKSVTTSWDEIVFEYRNKEYGAYPLRYNYPKTISISTLIVISVFLAVMIGRQILKEEISAARQKKVTVINYTELEQPPPIEKIEIEAPKAAAKYVAPEVTAEEPEKEEEFMTMDNVRATLDAKPEEVPTGDETPQKEEVIVVEPPPPPPPPPVVIIKPPEFPGGPEVLRKWLSDHLHYPSMAVRMGIQGVVVVEFTVDINGKISNAKVVQSLHKLCDNEAIRLVKSMPEWIPADKNSQKTTVQHTLPIRFVLQ